MTTIETLKERYVEVKQRLAEAARRSGRQPEDVLLAAVSKASEPDQIRELIGLGQVDFAENRVQPLVQKAAIIEEWLSRHRSLPGVRWPRPADVIEAGRPAGGERPAAEPPGPRVRWHMIGHLQRNKARKVADLCRLVHSVDSLRLAEELQAIGLKRDVPIDVLVQVNCSGEAQKYGCAIPAALHLAAELESMVFVRPRGLMTMAAYSENPEDARPAFARCRELFHEIRNSGAVSPGFNILSMGMSGDYEVAIEEGANLVRVGTAIFGAAPAGAGEGGGTGEDDEGD